MTAATQDRNSRISVDVLHFARRRGTSPRTHCGWIYELHGRCLGFHFADQWIFLSCTSLPVYSNISGPSASGASLVSAALLRIFSSFVGLHIDLSSHGIRNFRAPALDIRQHPNVINAPWNFPFWNHFLRIIVVRFHLDPEEHSAKFQEELMSTLASRMSTAARVPTQSISLSVFFSTDTNPSVLW